MKRAATTLIVSLVALVASATFANAALRVPQVPVVGGGLQAYLISVGESINVNTDQDATQSWSHTVSGTTTYTIQFQSSPNAAIQQFGMYNASAVIPPLFFIMSCSSLSISGVKIVDEPVDSRRNPPPGDSVIAGGAMFVFYHRQDLPMNEVSSGIRHVLTCDAAEAP